jgi:hypothetical protein
VFTVLAIASNSVLSIVLSVSGGAKGGVFFTRRFAAGSGLNSSSLDFLPVVNVEEGEIDAMVGVGAVPIGKTCSLEVYFLFIVIHILIRL